MRWDTPRSRREQRAVGDHNRIRYGGKREAAMPSSSFRGYFEALQKFRPHRAQCTDVTFSVPEGRQMMQEASATRRDRAGQSAVRALGGASREQVRSLRGTRPSPERGLSWVLAQA